MIEIQLHIINQSILYMSKAKYVFLQSLASTVIKIETLRLRKP